MTKLLSFVSIIMTTALLHPMNAPAMDAPVFEAHSMEWRTAKVQKYVTAKLGSLDISISDQIKIEGYFKWISPGATKPTGMIALEAYLDGYKRLALKQGIDYKNTQVENVINEIIMDEFPEVKDAFLKAQRTAKPAK